MNPTIERSLKVSRIVVCFETVLFLIIGFFGYKVLGKFTPELFILRKPFDGKNPLSEKILNLLITIFYLLHSLGLAMLNPIIRN